MGRRLGDTGHGLLDDGALGGAPSLGRSPSPSPGVGQPLYRLHGIRHRHDLGVCALCARVHRSGGNGGVQVRRQYERRDALAHAAVGDLAHQVQPVSVGQPHVYKRGVQPALKQPKGRYASRNVDARAWGGLQPTTR
jgi:hypothetical protein